MSEYILNSPSAQLGHTLSWMLWQIQIKQESRAAARKPRDAASVLFC